jgi:ABC-type tungstate transport system substrate-binding protein
VGFVSYEVIHSTVKSRSLVKELSLAAVASVLIGFGTVVGMVGVGLYV